MIILTILLVLIGLCFLAGAVALGWLLLKTSKVLFGVILGVFIIPILLILLLII